MQLLVLHLLHHCHFGWVLICLSLGWVALGILQFELASLTLLSTIFKSNSLPMLIGLLSNGFPAAFFISISFLSHSKCSPRVASHSNLVGDCKYSSSSLSLMSTDRSMLSTSSSCSSSSLASCSLSTSSNWGSCKVGSTYGGTTNAGSSDVGSTNTVSTTAGSSVVDSKQNRIYQSRQLHSRPYQCRHL